MTIPPLSSLTKCPWCIAGFLVLIFGAGFWAGYTVGHGDSQAPGTVQQQHTETQKSESTLKAIDTVVRLKTKTLTKTVTEYKQIRDTLHDTVTLTQHIHDTTWVREAIQRCDSVVSACEAYQHTAVQKFKADSDVFRSLDREIAAYKAARPSFFDKVKTGLGWLAVGVLTDRLAIQSGH